jgi:hypothetical protein
VALSQRNHNEVCSSFHHGIDKINPLCTPRVFGYLRKKHSSGERSVAVSMLVEALREIKQRRSRLLENAGLYGKI